MSEQKNDNRNENKNDSKEKSNKKKIAILVIIFLLIFGIVLGKDVLLKDSSPSKTTEDKQKNTNPNKLQLTDSNGVSEGELDLSNAKEVKMKLQQQVDNSYVNYKININPVFQDSKSKGNLMIQNSAQNKGVLQVEIMDENNELIYKSPSLKPNQCVNEDVLLKQLNKGEHKCTAYFKTYDAQSLNQTGEVGFKIKLTVLN